MDSESNVLDNLSDTSNSHAPPKEDMRHETSDGWPEPNIINLADFLSSDLPPRELILSPWLPRQGLAMIHAYRGIGKTHLALGVAYAVACGSKFLNWNAPAAAGVLLMDGEMPAPTLQERLAAIVAGSDQEPIAPFRLHTPDLQPKDRPAFNLAGPDDQDALESKLDGIDLIVIDNLATLCRTGKTNDADSWLPIQAWALRQRANGKSVLFIHHSGKNGTQRGTSAKEDVLDTVIGLRRPSDYSPSEGARFEIHFDKARGFVGPESEPLEAALATNEKGHLIWTVQPLEDSIYQRVIDLSKEGLTQSEIAEEVGRHKSNVSRMIKRARAEGLIND